MIVKITQLSSISFIFACLLGSTFIVPGFTGSVLAQGKPDPCLKNNNGIGNNYDIFVELPTNSQTLGDPNNQIISIRIDPGNPGQMQQLTSDLEEQSFNTEEIDFVVAQVWDAEMKTKSTNLQCYENSQVDRNYTLYVNAD
jgi:hypothetical protein